MTGSNRDSESLLPEPTQVFTPLPIHIDPSFDSVSLERENHRPRWRSVACGWAFTIAVTEPQVNKNNKNNKTIDVSAIADEEEGRVRNQCRCRNKFYAWGSGAFGELGLGPGLTKTGRRAIAIKSELLNSQNKEYEILKVRAGLRHVLLLVKEQSYNNGSHRNTSRSRNSDTGDHFESQGSTSRTLLMGWGNNRQGQLGVLTRNSGDPEAVPYTEKELRGKFMEPTFILISRDSSERSAESAAVAAVAAAVEIVDMACGQNHSLVLFSDGSVYSSGLNKYGQLGPCHPASSSSSVSASASSKQEFRIGFEKVQGLPFVDSISCGWNHNAAMDTRPLKGKGRTTIYLWGRNDHGQLGNGVPIMSINMDLNRGNNVPGIVQLRIPAAPDTQDESDDVLSYCCGSEHTLVMTRSKDCYAWGWNEHGNCGSGNDTSVNLRDVPTPRKVRFPAPSSAQGSVSDSGQGWVMGGYGSSWVWM
ncbi:hypothetical protein BGZ65_000840 [Modicella reniformis]|uniref:Uncharacterized protein n=1 Tax=Modicella reniformis TaxID=1440133 RepID=A0A9P6ILU5_9FUNG|nr:hypothetical protein BGZ65_000840 [Modicella reniformis]